MIVEPTKKAFLDTWPGGYGENWVVYEHVTGMKEDVLVKACLEPFYNPDHIVLEIGCGTGFWVDKYLAPHFKQVIALDLLPAPVFKSSNVRYVEVPDRNYECFGVANSSVDFVWSFGVFCHLTAESVQKYLDSAFRKLKDGGKAVLYFSNTERRKGTGSMDNTEDKILWLVNNWEMTEAMLKKAGFINIRDLLPEHIDTMAYCEKP